MLVWVIYAQTNVIPRLQVVLSATSLCTSRHCFWWLHLRDLPKCVCFFPKVVPRVSALGLFTSKCFCDSPKQLESQCFSVSFLFIYFFCCKERSVCYFVPPPPCSPKWLDRLSVNKVEFPLTSDSLWEIHKQVESRTTSNKLYMHRHIVRTHTCTHVLKNNMEIFVLPPFPCLALVL